MITTDQEMNRMEELLDSYEKSIGLPAYSKNDSEVDKYMNMSRNVLEKLSQEDCAQIAYMLSSYAFYLQRMHNREASRITWAKKVLRGALADITGTYGGKFSTYEERRSQAIKTHVRSTAARAAQGHDQARTASQG